MRNCSFNVSQKKIANGKLDYALFKLKKDINHHDFVDRKNFDDTFC